MEFEPSYRYLMSLLTPSSTEEEAANLLDEAIRSSWLPKLPVYELDDFIKVCEELKKKGGELKIIAMSCIAQARCYKALKIIEGSRKIL
jgi:hypothetical protein